MSQPHILIKNGLIIDGTGNDPFAGDVLVHDKRIVAVGQEARASCPDGGLVEEIDASGCRVLPGMIDSHDDSLWKKGLSGHPLMIERPFVDDIAAIR